MKTLDTDRRDSGVARLFLGVSLVLAALTLGACDGAPPGGSNGEIGPAPRAKLGDTDPRVAAAIEELLDRVEQQPRDGAARGELGVVYEAHGVHAAALECYEQATTLDPTEARWPYLAALAHARRGALDAALARLEQSLALDDSYLSAHLYRGSWLLDRGRLDEAEQAFARAEQLDPGGTDALVGRARVLLGRGNVAEAAARLESLLGRRPGDPYVKQLLGTAWARAGRVDQARTLLDGSREARPPRWPDARHDAVAAARTGFGAEMAMAEDLLASGRHAEAIELLEALRLERPDHTAMLNNLSVAYRQAGRADEAYAVLEDGLARHPDYFAFHLNISSDLARRGDPQRALEHLTRASELNPTIARPYLMKGQLLARARRLDEALEAFESALRYEPREATALFYGGVLALELGDAQRARELLVRAIEVTPDNASAIIGLATARMRQGEFDEAGALLDRARAIQPGNRQLASAESELERRRSGDR